MRILFYVIFMTSVFWSCVSTSMALVSPAVQREAEEWLYIRVLKLQQDEEFISVQASVLHVFNSKNNLFRGDIIWIDYIVKPQDRDLDQVRPLILGPGYPRLLKEYEKTYAFLNAGEGGRYKAGAYVWTFAEPTGIDSKRWDECKYKAKENREACMDDDPCVNKKGTRKKKVFIKEDDIGDSVTELLNKDDDAIADSESGKNDILNEDAVSEAEKELEDKAQDVSRGAE